MRILDLVTNVSEENEPIEWLTLDLCDGYISIGCDHWSNRNQCRQRWVDAGITIEIDQISSVIDGLKKVTEAIQGQYVDIDAHKRVVESVKMLGLSPTVEEALIAVGEEMREIGREEGAAVAFGLLGMVDAIRTSYSKRVESANAP